MKTPYYASIPFWITLISVLMTGCQESLPDPEYQRNERLQAILDQTLTEYHGKGVSAAIVFDEQEIWTGSSGISYGSTELSTDMALCIGSVTKTYMAALCIKLAEEGWFSLDDSLHHWLSDFKNVDNSITIKQLLQNTSGVYNVTDHPDLWEAVFEDPAKLWTPEEVLSEFLEVPYGEPGTGWHYSNTNYLLLGMIIRTAVGSESADLLRDRFLKPLGLDQTYFAVQEELPPNTAHGWFNLSGKGAEDISLIPNDGIYSVLWTAGAIFATPENLARWCSSLFHGSVLNNESLDLMLETYCAYPGTTDVECAMGLFRFGPGNSTGMEMMGYTGRSFGYLTSMFFLPGNGMSIAVIINEDNTELLDEVTTALILQVLEIGENRSKI